MITKKFVSNNQEEEYLLWMQEFGSELREELIQQGEEGIDE